MQVGPYEIVARLGAGGMGEVFKARDPRLNRFVAIKFLRPAHAHRFIREAQAASALNHPNIITIHDVANDGTRDYLVMEYVAGKTLDALIPRGGMRLGELLKSAVQIADGLSAAHAASIVHRDLKPANIMVSESGLVKVLDFGLAQSEEPSETTAQQPTRSMAVIGTPAYMSPEQAENGPVDARSDIFSFGAVLYEMMTGRRAFETTTALLSGEPKPFNEAATDLPNELQRITLRCLRRDPGKRLQHMADLKVLLEGLQEDSESGRLAAMGPARSGWRRWSVAAILLLAAAGTGLSVWVTRRHGEQPMRVSPLTRFAGVECCSSFSPDGNQVAFVWDGGEAGKREIYVKMLGSSTALRLSSNGTTDGNPSWSPDGRQIAFAKGGSAPGIYLVSPLGGPEQKITDLRSFGPISWSEDGKFLAVVKSHLEQFQTGVGTVYLVSTETGEFRPLLVPRSGSRYYSPVFAPGGRALAVAVCGGRNNYAPCDISVISLRPGFVPEGSERRLATAEALTAISWTADGGSLVYDGSIEGRLSLSRVATNYGAVPQRLELAGERVQGPAVARNSKLLAFTRLEGDDQLSRLKLGGRQEIFLASNAIDGNPEFSPDGQRVVFTSTRGLQGTTLWLAKSDGTGAVQLTRGPEEQGSPDWSPDGRWIAFDASEAGKYQIKVVDASGGHPRQVTSTSFDSSAPRWSRDGRSIYFSSNRTGRDEIWRAPATGGGAEQMTHDGGIVASESSDGKTLYYLKEGPARLLYSRPVAGGQATKVGLKDVLGRNYVVFKDGIYYVHGRRTPEIRFYSFATSSDSLIATVEGPVTLGFSVSPDRNTFLFTRENFAGASLMMIENFR
jgi:Tol biopolymer transport system component/tRNA A-37 threonylcarbamoyl transferase component Bud32